MQTNAKHYCIGINNRTTSLFKRKRNIENSNIHAEFYFLMYRNCCIFLTNDSVAIEISWHNGLRICRP